MNAHEILGQQIVRDAILGDAAAGGFDLSSLVSAAAELSQKGVATYEANQASDKTKKDQTAALAKASTADAAWASAEQMLDLANQSHDPTRVAAASALQQSAQSQALAAGATLTADSVAKRVAATHDAAAKAAQDSLSNPSDASKAALMRGWQKVAGSAGASGSASSALALAHGGKGSSGPSFFTKVHAGIPTWGWMVGGAVTVTGLALLIRALRKK